MQFIIIILLVIVVRLTFIERENHEERINEYLSSMGGKVLTTERKSFLTGPFLVVGKGRRVYRFEYKIGNEIKEGWVKFGGLMGPDWRL